MPLVEKHGGIWLDNAADLRTQPVFEQYDPALDLLAVVVRISSGHFNAPLFEKVADPQWRLPSWCERRPAAFFGDESSAVMHVKALLLVASGA